jgi:hypothetical protein
MLHVAPDGEQSDPTADNLGIDGIGSAEELLEEFTMFAGADANTVINDMEPPSHSMAVETHGNDSSVVTILDGIGDKVLDDRVEFSRINPYVERFARVLITDSLLLGSC